MFGRMAPFPSIHSLFFDSRTVFITKSNSHGHGNPGEEVEPTLLCPLFLGHRKTAGQNEGEGD